MRYVLVTGVALFTCLTALTLEIIGLAHSVPAMLAGKLTVDFYALEVAWIALWLCLPAGTYLRLRWLAAVSAAGLLFLSAPMEEVWFPPIALCLLLAILVPAVWFPGRVECFLEGLSAEDTMSV